MTPYIEEKEGGGAVRRGGVKDLAKEKDAKNYDSLRNLFVIFRTKKKAFVLFL